MEQSSGVMSCNSCMSILHTDIGHVVPPAHHITTAGMTIITSYLMAPGSHTLSDLANYVCSLNISDITDLTVSGCLVLLYYTRDTLLLYDSRECTEKVCQDEKCFSLLYVGAGDGNRNKREIFFVFWVSW